MFHPKVRTFTEEVKKVAPSRLETRICTVRIQRKGYRTRINWWMDAVAVAKLKKFHEDFGTPILPAKAGWLRKNVHGEEEGGAETRAN